MPIFELPKEALPCPPRIGSDGSTKLRRLVKSSDPALMDVPTLPTRTLPASRSSQ